jgi:hypothetical protein
MDFTDMNTGISSWIISADILIRALEISRIFMDRALND